MPPSPHPGRAAAWVVPGCAAALLALAPPAFALRVTTWNLLNYPGLGLSARQPHFRTVMAALETDVLVVQELTSIAGRDSFLANVLNVVEPGEWAVSGYIASTESAIYYKPARVSVSGLIARATSGPRDVLEARIRPVGYLSDSAMFRVFSVHFKAGGPGTPDSTDRRLECTDLRTFYLNTLPFNSHFLVGGDTNFYGAQEGGYIRLTESQPDNDGRCRDPLVLPGTWNNNSGYGLYHTQCPCLTPGSDCLAGFSGGGMDDRFDLWLSSISLRNGEGLDLLTGANYVTYGNDGQHYNMNIDGGGFNNAVGVTVAAALRQAADHLPVIATLQLPALSSAPLPLVFGDVLVGASATQDLLVSNLATAPADELDYTPAYPAGFSGPTGPFQAQAGAAPNSHTVAMDTSTPGARAGNLVISSDDFENPTRNVALSGNVLDHAEPSLDSLAAMTGTTLDFGIHDAGEFQDMEVRLHNLGYDPQQARLQLTAATVTGGDGRFSLVGGFSPLLLAGVGQTYAVHFEDAGATTDSAYTATLTFASSDEALPGALPRSDVTVALVAEVSASGVPVGPRLPTVTRVLPARPNPARGSAQLGFDLAASAEVSLTLYDLRGRKVATLAQGGLFPGRYRYRWDASSDAGTRLPAGIYFVRFTAAGQALQTTRLVLLD